VMNSGLVESFGPRDEILGKYLRPQAVPGGGAAGAMPAAPGQNTPISMV